MVLASHLSNARCGFLRDLGICGSVDNGAQDVNSCNSFESNVILCCCQLCLSDSDIDSEVCVEMLKRFQFMFKNKKPWSGRVLKLFKSLYGLRQVTESRSLTYLWSGATEHCALACSLVRR